MPTAHANGIDLYYETIGDPWSPPLLLVMGLGSQMISWDEELCEELAGRGFHVIRFDNRDAGLSTKLDESGVPDLANALTEGLSAPYTLDDMARDTIELLDVLNVRHAHIAGTSMGGMIAQLVAIHHPDRVMSLTSIMSSPGGDDLVPPTDAAAAALVSPPAATRQERIANAVRSARVLAGPGFTFDEDRARARAERAHDRCFYPDGTARQLAAILTAPGRAGLLSQLQLPAVVVHGDADPFLPVENGTATAAAIPGSRLRIIPGLGHDLPVEAWPRIIDAICEATGQAVW